MRNEQSSGLHVGDGIGVGIDQDQHLVAGSA